MESLKKNALLADKNDGLKLYLKLKQVKWK